MVREVSINSAEDQDALLRRTIDELVRLTRKKRELARAGIVVRVIAVMATVGIFVAMFAFHVRIHFGGFLWMFVAGGNALAKKSLASAEEADLARTLESLGDVRAIGPLAAALSIPKIDQSVVIAALTKLLPLLKASDASHLKPQHREALFGALRQKDRTGHADFLVALLGALEQIGDGVALENVRWLMSQPVRTGEEQSVFEAAYHCRDALLEAEKLEQKRQTLLRPADSAEPESILLRPAQSEHTAEPLLLRPTSTDAAH